MTINRFSGILKFAGLSDAQSLKLSTIFKAEINLERNDYFINHGAICSKIGLIVEGMCRYFYINENGDEITRWVSLGNEFVTSFGSFISRTPANENIQALKPTKMIVATKYDWDVLYAQEEFLRIIWAKSIESYLVDIEARVYSLIALNAQSRYDKMIENYPDLVKEVPDKYMASILGVKPRHFSRLRAKK